MFLPVIDVDLPVLESIQLGKESIDGNDTNLKCSLTMRSTYLQIENDCM